MTLSVRLNGTTRVTLARLASVSGETAAGLEALRDDGAIASPDALTRRLIDLLGDGWSLERGQALVRVLFSAVLTMDHQDSEAAEVAAAYAADEELELDDEQREQLRASLTTLISPPSVTGLARAAQGLNDIDRVLHASKSIVDVRTVVGLHDEPIGALILRRLHINYVENGEFKEADFLLEPSDIAEMRSALDRLERGALRASSMVTSAGLTIFNFDDEDDRAGN